MKYRNICQNDNFGFVRQTAKELGIILFEIREKSDYDDFYVASRMEAEEQLENAKYFVQKLKST